MRMQSITRPGEWPGNTYVSTTVILGAASQSHLSGHKEGAWRLVVISLAVTAHGRIVVDKTRCVKRANGTGKLTLRM